MPNDTRLSSALQKRDAQKQRKKPAPKAPKADPMLQALVTGQEMNKAQLQMMQEKADATMEVLEHILKEDRTVTLETGQLDAVIDKMGDKIAEEIGKMPAPVVNIPPRPPVTYRVTDIEHDRNGRLRDAKIVPVTSD